MRKSRSMSLGSPSQHANGAGAIFSLASVVGSYLTRPPYAPALFDALDALIDPACRHVLELGCGPAFVARALAQRGRRVTALDPAEGMIALAENLEGGASPLLDWVSESAESFAYPHQYGLVVAAQSLHWMDWDVVFPALKRSLSPGGWFAVVGGRQQPLPWNDELVALIKVYSSVRTWVDRDIFALLDRGGYFDRFGEREVEQAVETAVEDYIESFHARTGFARELMGEGRAAEFDRKLARLIAACGVRDTFTLHLTDVVTWGRPR